MKFYEIERAAKEPRAHNLEDFLGWAYRGKAVIDKLNNVLQVPSTIECPF
jgi:hypothetical protein